MLQIVRWHREDTAGDDIVIAPPEGRDHGTIVVRERVRPLTSLRGAPAASLSELIGDAVRVTTAEGELAAVHDDERGTRAVIWGDAEQTEITGVAGAAAARGAIATVVRELVHHLPLGLGSDRTRRYWYRPPAGWRGVASGLVTDWHAPDGAASLKVLPARRVERPKIALAVEQFLHDDAFFGFTLTPPITQDPITLGSLRGIRGEAVGERAGRARSYVTVAVEDARYLYAIRLACDGPSAGYEPMLAGVLASIEPIAEIHAPAVDQAAVAETMAHWGG